MVLLNKTAVITGGGDGIGLAAVRLFAENGAKTAVLEINEEKGIAIETEIKAAGYEIKFIKCDISNYDETKNAFEQVGSIFGGLDILYNNASVFLGNADAPVTELEPEIWHKILSINLSGVYHCCKFAIPLMKNGGSIINTASSAAVIGIPGCDAYTASKGATVALTRSMAVEYGPEGIRVNCIAPAAIYTPMVYQSNLSDPNFNEEQFLTKGTPLRRWGQPWEIASIAMFLASEQSSYINGAVITADGGITIM